MSKNRPVFGLVQDHNIVTALDSDKTGFRWCWITSSNIGRDKSFVYDLNIKPGIVRVRVAFVSRSAEIQPVFWRFVHSPLLFLPYFTARGCRWKHLMDLVSRRLWKFSLLCVSLSPLVSYIPSLSSLSSDDDDDDDDGAAILHQVS